jgi:hypothetical protein
MKFFRNEYLNQLMTIPKGHYICPRCKGVGLHNYYDQDDNSCTLNELIGCWLCDGDGYVDWVTNMFKQKWEEEDLEVIEFMKVEEWVEDYFQEERDWENSSFDIDINCQRE